MKILLGAASRDYDWVNDSVATFAFLSHTGKDMEVTTTRDADINMRIEDSTYIDMGRNKLVQDAKDFDADYLFMMDSDVYLEDFSTMILSYFASKLIKEKADVIAGIYVSAMNGKPSLSIYYLVGGAYIPVQVWPETIREVDATGGGFLMMNRKVINFTKGKEKLFDRYLDLGEDISFSNRIVTAGFKIIADPSIQLGHKKAKGLNRKIWERGKD